MQIIKKHFNASIALTITSIISLQISAMESPEQRAQERLINQLRQQQQNQQQLQAPQNILATREITMKQIVLNERDRDIQQLELKLVDASHKSTELQEELERLQIPIDLYLLEPSEELENETQQMQNQSNQPTIEQQTEQNQRQQEQLELIQQQLILKQIQQQQPKRPLPQPVVPQKQPRRPLPQPVVKQEPEENICCIEAVGCTEDQGVGPIPCKNKHNDLICNACLQQIKNTTNKCPMCQEPFIGS